MRKLASDGLVRIEALNASRTENVSETFRQEIRKRLVLAFAGGEVFDCRHAAARRRSFEFFAKLLDRALNGCQALRVAGRYGL